MAFEFTRKHHNVLFFVLTASITCGMVFMASLSSFAFMLTENGVSAKTISLILLCSFPHSCKFITSVFIKNALNKFANSKVNIIKVFMLSMQILIIILLSFIVLLTDCFGSITAGILMFLLTLAVSIQDIVSDYVRLQYFQGKDIAISTSICTIGFRIGLLIGGAGILYVAESFNWSLAFAIIATSIFPSILSTIALKRHSTINKELAPESIKKYFKFCKNVLAKYGIVTLFLFFLTYKFPDTCINSLKPIFLQSKGIQKIDFANISQILGFVSMLAGSSFSGFLAYKIGTSQCLKISFVFNMLCSICFMILTKFNITLLETAIFVNVSTFLLSFSTAILRIYISEEAKQDINKYTILLSLGAAARTIILYISGSILDMTSWMTLFFICFLTSIPGFIAYAKLLKTQNA